MLHVYYLSHPNALSRVVVIYFASVQTVRGLNFITVSKCYMFFWTQCQYVTSVVSLSLYFIIQVQQKKCSYTYKNSYIYNLLMIWLEFPIYSRCFRNFNYKKRTKYSGIRKVVLRCVTDFVIKKLNNNFHIWTGLPCVSIASRTEDNEKICSQFDPEIDMFNVVKHHYQNLRVYQNLVNHLPSHKHLYRNKICLCIISRIVLFYDLCYYS